MNVNVSIVDELAATSRLRESEERFRGAFEFAAIGMALVAPDGRWLRVNRSLCGIVGYTADELLSTDFQSITYQEDLETDVGFVRQMLDGSLSHYDMEKRYHHKDGHIVWVLLSVSLVRDAMGEAMYFVSQIQDITERKRLERALREATHREHRRLGQEIHDGLGQELTGLAYLAGSLATVARRTHSPLAKNLAKLADVASHTIETCRSIARGVSPLTESRGSLVQSLRHIADLAATGGHASVKFEAIENAPLMLPYGSLDQLHRITQEAVNNALRHSEADNIQVMLQVDPVLVTIKVVDNGRGLGSNGEVRAGLGIDSMRQRAATIGARLRVDSRRRSGTAIVCECPQRAPSEAPAICLRNE
jgi:PAS domain S-box-containing protein